MMGVLQGLSVSPGQNDGLSRNLKKAAAQLNPVQLFRLTVKGKIEVEAIESRAGV